MYTEDLGDPRRFARIARRVSQHRPIVAVRTSADLGPTNSALYRHCGLIEVPTVAALLDTVRVLATQPVLRGDRVAVLSNYPSPQRLASAGDRGARAAAGRPPAAARLPLDTCRLRRSDRRGAALRRHRRSDGGLRTTAAPRRSRRSPRSMPSPMPPASRSRPCSSPPPTVRSRPARTSPTSCSPSRPPPCSADRGPTAGGWPRRRRLLRPWSTMSTVDGADELIAGALLDGMDRLDPATTADLLATYGITVPPTRFVAIGDAVDAADRDRLPGGRQGSPSPRRTIRARRGRPRSRRCASRQPRRST